MYPKNETLPVLLPHSKREFHTERGDSSLGSGPLGYSVSSHASHSDLESIVLQMHDEHCIIEIYKIVGLYLPSNEEV